MIRLVQVRNGSFRRVALVEEPHLKCLDGVESTYALSQASLCQQLSLSEYARTLAIGELLDYEAIYAGTSDWHLLSPIDFPNDPARLLITGTGLTHLGSAKERQAMHVTERPKADENITDSMKMFEWGIKGGRPANGEVGIAPEWFYKGDGSMLRAPFAPLTTPSYAEDGGEEAEIAGVYLVGEDGKPHRIGMAAGNEFSDHKFEKRNYLNLAGSKLRTCSIGPELVIGAEFYAVAGEVHIERAGEVIWQKKIETGEDNMCHSLANLEHHHFKFEGHRQPGNLHVHFFGAHSLSFGNGLELRNGDWTEVSFEGYGRPLRNSVRVEEKEGNRPVRVNVLS